MKWAALLAVITAVLFVTNAHEVAAQVAPGAPSIASVSPRDTELRITWTAPASDGGSTIDLYDARYIGSDAIGARLEALGVTVLRNARTEWGAIRIIGIDDAEERDQVGRVLARMGADIGERDRTAFTILMYHRPDGAEDAARAGVDLMLCGHTHNGQLVPFDWLVKRYFPRIAGRFDVDGMVLYVSPGTGTWGPTMRLGSSNEITVFELSPAPPMESRTQLSRGPIPASARTEARRNAWANSERAASRVRDGRKLPGSDGTSGVRAGRIATA